MTGATAMADEVKIENANTDEVGSEDTVIIEDRIGSNGGAKEDAKAPTSEDLQSAGWTEAEIKAAGKRGMVGDGKEEKEEEKKEEKKEPEEEKKEEKEEKKAPPEKGSLPDLSMTEEQEKLFNDLFPKGNPNRAFYYRAKNERKARQVAQDAARKAQARADALTERLKVLETSATLGRKDTTGANGDIEFDAEGNIIDPDEKPLTLKALKEMQAAQLEQQQKEAELRQARSNEITTVQQEQEDFARGEYEDFDATVKQAEEVIKNLDELVTDGRDQRRVKRLVRDLQLAANSAGEIPVDGDTAAMIAYEIGQFHPKYGISSTEEGKDGKGESETSTGSVNDPTANGGLTPEKMERIVKNTQRRASSASVQGGGGKRKVAVSEIGLAELNSMSAQQRLDFRAKYPDRYTELLRG